MSSSNFCFQLILLLTIIISITSTNLKDDDILYLIQVEYGYNISNFTVEVLNRDDAEINEFLPSRIAFMNGSDSDKEIFDLYSPYMNKYWFFFVNSIEVANSLLEKDDYEKDELYINGIIIPESLNYSMPEQNNNKKIPIFIVQDNITKTLYNYDIRCMNKHIYFLFEIKRAISSYPETYFLIISIISTLIGIGLFIFWKVKTKSLAPENILPFQKMFSCLPILCTILSILFIIKSVLIRGEDPNRESQNTVYVDVVLVVMEAVFRTFLWLFTIMLSFGWSISIQGLSPSSGKFMLKMTLLIYILNCIDPLLDSFVSHLWIFHLSEIKNIIFVVGILIYLFKRVKKTLRAIERKLYFARILSLDYTDVLVFKIKYIKQLYWIFGSYGALFLIILLLHKTAVLPYDTITLELYDYTFVDICLLAILLIIFRPRTLPRDFKTDIGNEEEYDFGFIYKAFLPKYNLFNSRFEENKHDIHSVKGKNVPILILGPCLSHVNDNAEEPSINNYINNIEIGFST